MIETYEFIAYLSYQGRRMGMRIRILGDIGGHSVFDVGLKLLRKYGVVYSASDTSSPVIEVNADDCIPELTEDTKGFHKWILYNSKKFGVSEYFTCNCIDSCEMCPLSSVYGYCSGTYGCDVCKEVLGLDSVPVRDLVRYCRKNFNKEVAVSYDINEVEVEGEDESTVVIKKSNKRRKSNITSLSIGIADTKLKEKDMEFSTDTISSKPVAYIKKSIIPVVASKDSGESQEIGVISNNSPVIEVDELSVKNDKPVVSDREFIEVTDKTSVKAKKSCAKDDKPVKIAKKSNEKSNKSSKGVKKSETKSPDKSESKVKANRVQSKTKVDAKDKRVALELSIGELRSKISLRRAFEQKLNVFDEDFIESKTLRGMRMQLDKKEHALSLLVGE